MNDCWSDYVYVRQHKIDVIRQAKEDYQDIINGNYEKWEAFTKIYDDMIKRQDDRIGVMDIKIRNLNEKLQKLSIIYLIITCAYIAILVLRFLK